MSVSLCTRLPTRRACWNKAFRTVPTVPLPWAGGQRVLDLAEDLTLPDHQRVQTGGDREEVRDRTLVEVDRATVLQLGDTRLRPVRRVGGGVVEAAVEPGHRGVDLGAVAGGQHDRLVDVVRIEQRPGQLAGGRGVHRELGQQGEVGRLVRDADAQDAHPAPTSIPSVLRCSW